jgi:hypothetical protein
MKTLMKTFMMISVLALTLLAVQPAQAAQVSFGIQIGTPPPAPVYIAPPPSPGPDYVWVDGYYYPVSGHWRWHAGYWTRAPYAGAHWYGPRYEGGRFYNGYWGGDRGRIEHNHSWDKHKDRDYRGRPKDNDHH